MLLVVELKINCICVMENNNYDDKILAIEEVCDETKVCSHCKKTLPITSFRKFGKRTRSICKECEAELSGVSDKFRNFTSRELMEELRNRGFIGILRKHKVEEFKL